MSRQGEVGSLASERYVSDGNVVRLDKGYGEWPIAAEPRAKAIDTPIVNRETEAELVSVVTANYNGARFLSKTIQSVLNQTYPYFEFIIVDDGSTDDSIAIIKHWSELDSRVKPIYLAKNRGVGAARNVGIDLCVGEYVAFIDADDLWLPEKLEKQIELFKAHPHAGLVVTAAATIDDEDREIPSRKSKKAVQDGPVNVFDYVAGKFPVSINAMTKRACLDEVGHFNPNYLIGEDYELWMRICRHYEYYHIEEPLHQYRLHSSNATRRSKLVNRECKVKILEDAILNNPELAQQMDQRVNTIIQRKYNSLGKAYFLAGRIADAKACFVKARALNGSLAHRVKTYLWHGLLWFFK